MGEYWNWFKMRVAETLSLGLFVDSVAIDNFVLPDIQKSVRLLTSSGMLRNDIRAHLHIHMRTLHFPSFKMTTIAYSLCRCRCLCLHFSPYLNFSFSFCLAIAFSLVSVACANHKRELSDFRTASLLLRIWRRKNRFFSLASIAVKLRSSKTYSKMCWVMNGSKMASTKFYTRTLFCKVFS